ncbi:MAG: hypothetical protein QM761_10040 [Pseudoxanthomonas sp.]
MRRYGYLVLLAALYAGPIQATPPPADEKPAAATPIRSQAELETWLRQQQRAGQPTPFDRMTPGGRERFLSGGLGFGSKGLASLNPTVLSEELDPVDIRAVLALFFADPDAYLRLVPQADPRTRAIATQRRNGISDIEHRYNHFYLRDTRSQESGRMSDLELAAATEQAYEAEFAGADDDAKLRAYNDSDLQLLLRAAREATQYSDSGSLADRALAFFDEYERRGLAADEDVARIFDVLLAARRFDAAREFAARHPNADLPELPAIKDEAASGTPTLWEFSEDGKQLTRRALDLKPTQILVTAGCHFSADAAEDISADPMLGPVFRHHAHWLSLAPGRESLGALVDWNRKHPQARMTPIHDREEWLIIRNWDMPVFHIVRDGKIVESVTGWPRNPQENREPLIAALKRAGLLSE